MLTCLQTLPQFGVYTAIVAVLSVRTILLVAAWLFGATSIMSMCLVLSSSRNIVHNAHAAGAPSLTLLPAPPPSLQLLVANRVASEGLCRLFPMVCKCHTLGNGAIRP